MDSPHRATCTWATALNIRKQKAKNTKCNRQPEICRGDCEREICIQTLRLAAQHHCRRGERNQGTWDRAGEFTVTPILKNAKNDKGQDIFSLPKDALYSQQYENKEAEAIYKMLKEIEDQNQPPQNQPQQQPGPGQGSGKGKGKGKPQPGNDPGQGPPQPDPAGGEVRDLPGKDGQAATEAEKEQGRQDWKIATQQAAKIAKSCGKLPGELLRLVDDILERITNYRWTRRNGLQCEMWPGKWVKSEYTLRKYQQQEGLNGAEYSGFYPW